MTDPIADIFAFMRGKGPLTQDDVNRANALLDALGAAKAGPGLVNAAGRVTPAPLPPMASQPGSGAGGHPGGLRTSQKGIDLIHSFETCKLTAYPDPGSRDGNPWTIGWGSTGPGIARGVTWTQVQADGRFKADLAKFEKGVRDAIGSAPTTQSQFDAMVSLAYNIGIGAFAGSTVCRRHKAGEHDGAATAFGMWNKNDGQVLRGLVRRRAAEAELYRGRA